MNGIETALQGSCGLAGQVRAKQHGLSVSTVTVVFCLCERAPADVMITIRQLCLCSWNVWTKPTPQGLQHKCLTHTKCAAAAAAATGLSPLPRHLLPLFVCVLPLQLYKWDFSVFDLHKLTGGRPLYNVTMALLQDQGLLVRLQAL